MATGMVTSADSPCVVRFGSIEISDVELKGLSGAALIDRLVAEGMSRLSAERTVEIERGAAEPSRARAHAQARR
jgi:hypothetical protein